MNHLRSLRTSRAIVPGTPGLLVPLAVLGLLATVATSCGFVVVTPSATPADTSGSVPRQVHPPGAFKAPGDEGAATLPDIVSVVEQAAPSVVSVLSTVRRTDILGRVRRGVSSGSGVLFDPRGYILTNEHVVAGSETVQVVLQGDDRRWDAQIVGADSATDLAVLWIDVGLLPYQVEPSVLGDSQSLSIGEWVVAIGSPLGEEFAGSVTVGIVSGMDRSLTIDDVQYADLIQTDAVINPGNSGGPLLNLRGEIIGINTAVISGLFGAGQDVGGIGFAIATTTVRPIAEQLIRKGEVEWPALGVTVSTVTPRTAIEHALAVDRGVMIRTTLAGGPAEGAGMEATDVVISLDGQPVETVTQLRLLLLTRYAVGDTVEVAVNRHGRELVFSVRLAGLTAVGR